MITTLLLIFQLKLLKAASRDKIQTTKLTEKHLDLEHQFQDIEKDKLLILNSMAEVVVFYDASYKILWASKTAINSGLRIDKRHTSSCCMIWENEHIACGHCPVNGSMQSQEFREGEVRGDDGRIWKIRVYPVFADDASFKGILEFAFDISRIREAETILLRNQKELELLVADRTNELTVANQKLKSQISDRKNAENALFQNEYKFRSLVRNSPDGIVLLDETGIILEWNDSLNTILGISRNDALGRHYMEVYKELVPEPDRMDMMDLMIFNEILHKGFADRFDQRLMRESVFLNKKEGKRIVQVKIFAIASSNGHKIAGIFRNITEEKIREQKIVLYAQKLKAIFNNNFQSFILMDTFGTILEFNKASLEMAIHLSSRNIEIGDKLNDFLDSVTSLHFKMLFKKILKGNVEANEYEFTFKSGERRWYEVHMAAIYSVDGKIESVFLNSFDIHNRKIAAIEKTRMLEQEMELNALKSQFVSAVSHEFRSPLSSIYSHTQLLQHYYALWDNEKREKTFSRIYDSVKHLTAMLQDVSFIGKVQNGLQKFEPEMKSVLHLCYHIMDECQVNNSAKDRIVFINNTLQNDYLIDSNLIRHILSNILANALKYSSGSEKVIFEVLSRENELLFIVKDKGIGIPNRDLKNIYQSFFRASNVGEIPGTGLGMAIVKQSVAIHNGSIEVESAQGKGTMVTVRIPV